MTTQVNSDRSRLGKVFEAKVSQAFRNLQDHLPVQFKRILDSREAGNLVRATEADFEFKVRSVYPGAPYHFMIECKSSDKYSEFQKCFRQLVKANQRALMMIGERAGGKGIYLFFSSLTQEVEVWSGSVINEAWPDKRKPLNKQPMLRIVLAALPQMAELMATKPTEFLGD